MYRKTVAEINLKNLIKNLNSTKSLLSKDHFICPMVKANAYGHGAIAVSKCLVKNGVAQLGVALIEEGIELRKNGIEIDILVFGSFGLEGLKACREYRLTPVIGSMTDLHCIKKIDSKLSIHLKFDTGMNRMGFVREEISSITDYLNSCDLIKIQGICTHLATSEDLNGSMSQSSKQLEDFSKILRLMKRPIPMVHALNSGGVLGVNNFSNYEVYQKFGVRPGLLLYGVNPMSDIEFSVLPVMSLKSQLIKIQKVQKGKGVSYGHTWKASEDSYIGVVSMGYADGVFRSLSNRLSLIFQSHRVPIVGTVCMDYFMIDLTKVIRSRNTVDNLIGADVYLFGEDRQKSIHISDVARSLSTNAYEVMSRVGMRVPRVYNY